jgi:hypothetical protein
MGIMCEYFVTDLSFTGMDIMCEYFVTDLSFTGMDIMCEDTVYFHHIAQAGFSS